MYDIEKMARLDVCRPANPYAGLRLWEYEEEAVERAAEIRLDVAAQIRLECFAKIRAAMEEAGEKLEKIQPTAGEMEAAIGEDATPLLMAYAALCWFTRVNVGWDILALVNGWWSDRLGELGKTVREWNLYDRLQWKAYAQAREERGLPVEEFLRRHQESMEAARKKAVAWFEKTMDEKREAIENERII